jgi:hypothetical protein
MDLYYEGFAVLAREGAATLGSAHTWEPDIAPDVPAEFATFAPAAPAWQRSTTLDSETGASVWLDPGTATVYFSYLRG